MCGIAGWVEDVGGNREALLRMCDVIAYRGPDAAGPDFPGVDRYLALDTATYLPGDRS